MFEYIKNTRDEDVPEAVRQLILDNFPFDSPWAGQVGIIYDVLQAYSSGKKYAVLNIGTGGGKSVIAVTLGKILSKFAGPVKITTKTRTLQKQYEDSFGSGVQILWGKTHYSDLYEGYEGKVHTCGKSCPGFTYKHESKECLWTLAKGKYMGSDVGVTNNAMYLSAPPFRSSHVVIVDECHNAIEDLIELSRLEISSQYIIDRIEEYKLDEYVNTKYLKTCADWESSIPEGEVAGKNIVIHLNRLADHVKTIIPHFTEVHKHYEKLAEEYPTKTNMNAVDKLAGVINKLCTLVRLAPEVNQDSACFESLYTRDENEHVVSSTIVSTTYQPAESAVKILTNSTFVIMMSATTGSYEQVSKALRMSPNDGIYVESPVAFPVENRKVHIEKVGSVNYKNIKTMLSPEGSIIKRIQSIMNQHLDVRGIIHSVSYSNAYSILESLRELDSYLANRIVIPPKGTQVDEDYISSLPVRSVIVSPSVTEGVDFKNDLARFQIIMKIPFGYLGDTYVASKADKDPDWYLDTTAKVVTQMVGRIVRSATDYGDTYILDSSYDRINAFLPKWLRDAEVYSDSES